MKNSRETKTITKIISVGAIILTLIWCVPGIIIKSQAIFIYLFQSFVILGALLSLNRIYWGRFLFITGAFLLLPIYGLSTLLHLPLIIMLFVGDIANIKQMIIAIMSIFALFYYSFGIFIYVFAFWKK